MSIFQLIMITAAAFFAYEVYAHIQNIEEEAEPESMKEVEALEENSEPSDEDKIAQYEKRIQEADKSYLDGNISKAKEMLEEIVKEYPTVAEGMNKLAFILAKENEDAEALLYYRASLRIVPEDDMTHNAIARLLVKLENYKEAEEHYMEAIKIDDNYEITWFNYASLMLVLEKNDEAKEMFTKALAIDPDFEEAKVELEKLS